MVTPHKVFLVSYDDTGEVLEYQPDTGAFAILSRRELERRGLRATFGGYMREGKHVLGIFASPGGPVLFHDDARVLGRHGQVTATLPAHEPGHNRVFTLFEHDAPVFAFEYENRLGVGANPYDNDPEDIDVAASIATNIPHKAFFKLYTKDWVSPPDAPNVSVTRP